MKQIRTFLFIALFASTAMLPAQIPTQGYQLVYSSETPEAALAAMPTLTADELLSCTGDFLSRDNFERHWTYSPRRTSTWNKRMAENDADRARVHIAQDGTLHLLALTTDGTAEGFITSGMEMKQSYQYGIIEVKAKCNPHASNFPAIWMMPADQQAGWPNCGEIDIMEQIGTSSTVYSTVHLGARYEQPVGKSYAWSGNRHFDEGYHIYTLQWNPFSLTFYTDGIEVFRYVKDLTLDYQTHPEYEEAQFPYNKPYYIILDQALGMDENWCAQEPDPQYTYEMEVAYVRIFQGDTPEEQLPYYLIKNLSAPEYYMTVTLDDKLAGSSAIDVQCPDSNALFRFVPTADSEQYLLQSLSGKLIGSSLLQNSQIKVTANGTPYYLIRDESHGGVAFDYKQQQPDVSFAAGSRALILNADKGYIISTSGTSNAAAWWQLQEVTPSMSIEPISADGADKHQVHKALCDGSLMVIVGDCRYSATGVRMP